MRVSPSGLVLVAAVVLFSCFGAGPARGDVVGNPAAPGFDAARSDLAAIELADRVMQAMGGRDAWDRTHYITWSFFGRRTHLWDRKDRRSRIETKDDEGRDVTICFSLDAHADLERGKVWIAGQELVDAEAKLAWLDRAEAMWINDSYWLVMPYKLKDSGVTLKLVGPDTLPDGRAATVLELTFRNVGRTPQNKYHVYVGDDTNLVEQWSYFSSFEQDEPDLTTPWGAWTRHGKILLSGDRGERQITNIGVLEEIEPGIFERP